MRILRAATMVLAALLAATAAPAPAFAVEPFAPSITIKDPTCAFDNATVQTATDSAGGVRGFANLWGSDCNQAQTIEYFAGRGTGLPNWSRETSPYRGFPLDTAWDTTGTYLLYVGYPALDLRLAKRRTDGSYTAGQVLSTTVGSDGSLAQGSLVARDGHWWAAWREHVRANGTPGDEFDQTEIYEAGTFPGGPTGRTRVTTGTPWDGAPSLALNPAGSKITLLWTRGGSDFGDGGGPTDLWIGTRSLAGSWSKKAYTTGGYYNFWPEVTVTASSTYVVWNQDGKVVVRRTAGSAVDTRVFVTPGYQAVRPRIAVSPGVVAAAWTTTAGKVMVAERVGTTWSTGYAAQSPGIDQILTGLSNTGGRSTVVVASDEAKLYARTETP